MFTGDARRRHAFLPVIECCIRFDLPSVPNTQSDVSLSQLSHWRVWQKARMPFSHSKIVSKGSEVWPNCGPARPVRPPFEVALVGGSFFITHSSLSSVWMCCSTMWSPLSQV